MTDEPTGRFWGTLRTAPDRSWHVYALGGDRYRAVDFMSPTGYSQIITGEQLSAAQAAARHH